LSEYQYYEFLAVDRPLDHTAMAALRQISSRARITATSFSNHYEWGDLKANPIEMLAEHFDLHVYVANWNTRVFAMRLPRALVDLDEIERFAIDKELLRLREIGEYLIVEVTIQELQLDEADDGEGWLAALAPLRAAVLRGDLRLFYLLWLLEVSFEDWIPDDASEPLSGLGTLDLVLSAFADFLDLDGDLLTAAAEGQNESSSQQPSQAAVEVAIRSLDDAEKTQLLLDLHRGENQHLSIALRRRVASLVGRIADTALGEARVGCGKRPTGRGRNGMLRPPRTRRRSGSAGMQPKRRPAPND
jgi:hypothetical protein